MTFSVSYLLQTLVSRHLVKEGTKVSVPNEYGDTPLHCYIKSGRDDRLDLLLGLLVHCNVKLLDINKEDNNGDTPLHVATKVRVIKSITSVLKYNTSTSTCISFKPFLKMYFIF